MDVVIPVLTNEQFIEQVLALLGGIKGASSLAIIAILAQVFMKFVGTPWADILANGSDVGKYKLTIFLFCTYLLSVVTQIVAGVSVVQALTSATALSALMVLLNQIYKQFFQKP